MTGSDQQLGGPAPIWFGVLFLAVALRCSRRLLSLPFTEPSTEFCLATLRNACVNAVVCDGLYGPPDRRNWPSPVA